MLASVLPGPEPRRTGCQWRTASSAWLRSGGKESVNPDWSPETPIAPPFSGRSFAHGFGVPYDIAGLISPPEPHCFRLAGRPSENAVMLWPHSLRWRALNIPGRAYSTQECLAPPLSTQDIVAGLNLTKLALKDLAGLASLLLNPVTARKTPPVHHPKFFHEDMPCLKGICYAAHLCFRLCPLQPTDEP